MTSSKFKMTTKYADSELDNGIHTQNGQARVTDSGDPEDGASAHICETQTKHHPVDKGYAWDVLGGKHTSHTFQIHFQERYLNFKYAYSYFIMSRNQ